MLFPWTPDQLDYVHDIMVLVVTGNPALDKSNKSLWIVRTETSKYSASSCAVIFSLSNKIHNIPNILLLFIQGTSSVNFTEIRHTAGYWRRHIFAAKL